MKKRITVEITGRVQFVMFRDFTRRNALSLDVNGWVKNNDDGSVSIVAEGEEEHLKKFLQFVSKGSLLARVDNVHVEWGTATGEFTTFVINY